MDVHSSMVGVIFWVAIFGIVAVKVWGSRSAERERQQTLRAAIERGQQLDPAMLEKILAGQPQSIGSPYGLLIGGVVVLFAGAGLALLGVFVGADDPEAFKGVVGSAALIGMVGLGLCVAYALKRRLERQAGSALPPNDPAA
jgi:hypothetical protein